MWFETPISVVNDVYDLAQRLTIGPATLFAYTFRGQSNAEWTLKPSLLRSLQAGVTSEDAIGLENRALYEFQSETALYFESAHIPPPARTRPVGLVDTDAAPWRS